MAQEQLKQRRRRPNVPDGPVLLVTASAWGAFVGAVRLGPVAQRG
ncbi:DUF397 domain-containing protein [Streptomyces sp. ISL-12]|nr:DUF397 domain-containing protein [Streptomyces sp. ISL-12]